MTFARIAWSISFGSNLFSFKAAFVAKTERSTGVMSLSDPSNFPNGVLFPFTKKTRCDDDVEKFLTNFNVDLNIFCVNKKILVCLCETRRSLNGRKKMERLKAQIESSMIESLIAHIDLKNSMSEKQMEREKKQCRVESGKMEISEFET